MGGNDGRGGDKTLIFNVDRRLPKEPVVSFVELDALLRGQGEVDGRALLRRRPGEVEGAASQKLLDLGDAVLVGGNAAKRHHRDAASQSCSPSVHKLYPDVQSSVRSS